MTADIRLGRILACLSLSRASDWDFSLVFLNSNHDKETVTVIIFLLQADTWLDEFLPTFYSRAPVIGSSLANVIKPQQCSEIGHLYKKRLTRKLDAFSMIMSCKY